MNKEKYEYHVINSRDFDIDFDVINKWLNNVEEGEYIVSIKKVTRKDE